MTAPNMNCATPGCPNTKRKKGARYCTDCLNKHRAQRRPSWSKAKPICCAKCGNMFTPSGNCIYCEVCRSLPPAHVDLSRYKVNPPWQLEDGTYRRMCKHCEKVYPWDMAHFRQNKASAPGTVCVHCRDDETKAFRASRREVKKALPPRVVVEPPPKPKRILFFGEPTGHAISEPGNAWKVRREL